jgi:hypothetical protein
MSEIKTDRYSGGANLATGELAEDMRDVADDLAAIQPPSISASAMSAVAAADISALGSADIAAVAQAAPVVTAQPDVAETKGVVDGLIVTTPTTPSAQSADPGGVLDWNVNLPLGFIFVNSIGKYFTAENDLDVHSGTKLLDIGQAIYAWLVAAESGGTVTKVVVKGTAATSGSETIPTDGDITTGVGHANWCKVALLHGHRSADTVFAQTQNPSYMTKWAGAAAGLVNDLKAKYNAAVPAITELQTLAGTIRTLLNEVKTVQGTVRTLANEMKGDLAEVRAIANEVRTDLNTSHAATLKTTKG